MNFDFTKTWFDKTDWFWTNCSFLIENFVEIKFDHWCVKIEMFCWQDFVFYKCVKQVADVKFDCKSFEIALNDSSIMKNWNRSLLLLKKVDEIKNFMKKKFRRKKIRRILIFKNCKTNFVKKHFWKKKWKNFILFCAFQVFFFISQRKQNDETIDCCFHFFRQKRCRIKNWILLTCAARFSLHFTIV